jgi:hypothetical protein
MRRPCKAVSDGFHQPRMKPEERFLVFHYFFLILMAADDNSRRDFERFLPRLGLNLLFEIPTFCILTAKLKMLKKINAMKRSIWNGNCKTECPVIVNNPLLAFPALIA